MSSHLYAWLMVAVIFQAILIVLGGWAATTRGHPFSTGAGIIFRYGVFGVFGFIKINRLHPPTYKVDP